MKILPKQFYLALSSSRDAECESFKLRFTTDLESILGQWDSSTRISPTWRLKPNVDNSIPDGFDTSEAHLFFISGINPSWVADNLPTESLAKLGDDSIWLTLGAFNLVLISWFEDVSEQLTDLLLNQQIAHEIWSATDCICNKDTILEGNTIQISHHETDSSAPSTPSKLYLSAIENASIQSDDTLGFMTLELCALMSVIHTRSQNVFGAFSSDCNQIEELTALLLSDDNENAKTVTNAEDFQPDLPLAKRLIGSETNQDILLTLNAGLSRLSSQALSGTSPILKTECHYWPHSFLGTGVANIALRNLASFVTSLVANTRFNSNFNEAFSKPFSISKDQVRDDIISLPSYLLIKPSIISKFSNHANNQNKPEDKVASPDEVPNPVTYFSGRDGFRNNVLTTSAPLPSISGCNSYQWNLGTITHELTHRILSGKIVKILNGLLGSVAKSEQTYSSLKRYFDEEPTTVNELCEKSLGWAMLRRRSLDFSEENEFFDQLEKPTEFLESCKKAYAEEFEEIFVHAFDYYHFYHTNPKTYIEFVWLSWAVQPSIGNKLDEYIRRTLFALSIRHVGAENWVELAFDEFKGVLTSGPLFRRLDLSKEVIAKLEDIDCKKEYEAYLDVTRDLLTIFHLVFKSDKLRAEARREYFPTPKTRYISSGNGKRDPKKYNYSTPTGVFLDKNDSAPQPKFSNPLLFLRDFSRNEKPKASDSAWLLHMIAFNMVPGSQGSD